MRSSEYTREEKKTRRSILGTVANLVLLLLSVVAATSLLLTLLAPYIEPSVNWIFPVLGLIAPAVYITNLIFALYWIICWRLLYALPIVTLLLFGISNISLFVNMEVSKDYGLNSYRNMPKVMSYNIRRVINDDGQWACEDMAAYIEEQNVDIICFQEYNPHARKRSKELDEVLDKYSKVEYNTLAVYSRYPIIKSENIFDNDDDGRAIWADIVIKSDTIRLFNNHLHSTTINAADDEYLKSKQVIQDTLRRDKIRDMLSRFNHGSMERTKQVDTIANVIYNSPYPVVVCGDFNDTPISHTYNKMSRGLKDAFQESGIGYSYTYRGFYNMLRIDYILVDERISPHNYIVDEECTISDHLPIMTHIDIHKHK